MGLPSGLSGRVHVHCILAIMDEWVDEWVGGGGLLYMMRRAGIGSGQSMRTGALPSLALTATPSLDSPAVAWQLAVGGPLGRWLPAAG